MTRTLSWYQVNYTPSGRMVRANALTTYDDDNVIGRDLEVTIEGDVTEATILAAVRDSCNDQAIVIVPVSSP